MGMIDTLLETLTGRKEDNAAVAAGGQDPLAAALSSLLAKNGGLQGLMSKFSNGGLGEVFSSWVGMGENQSVKASQIEDVLGSEQVKGLASQLGVDPSQASGFLASYLPQIVDKLTPAGKLDRGQNEQQQGLDDLLPSLLSNLMGGKPPV
jgi:uncharacterized protein YidB (DUF937 family)